MSQNEIERESAAAATPTAAAMDSTTTAGAARPAAMPNTNTMQQQHIRPPVPPPAASAFVPPRATGDDTDDEPRPPRHSFDGPSPRVVPEFYHLGKNWDWNLTEPDSSLSPPTASSSKTHNNKQQQPAAVAVEMQTDAAFPPSWLTGPISYLPTSPAHAALQLPLCINARDPDEEWRLPGMEGSDSGDLDDNSRNGGYYQYLDGSPQDVYYPQGYYVRREPTATATTTTTTASQHYQADPRPSSSPSTSAAYAATSKIGTCPVETATVSARPTWEELREDNSVLNTILSLGMESSPQQYPMEVDEDEEAALVKKARFLASPPDLLRHDAAEAAAAAAKKKNLKRAATSFAAAASPPSPTELNADVSERDIESVEWTADEPA